MEEQKETKKMKPRPKTEYEYKGPTEAELITKYPELFVVRSHIAKYFRKFNMNYSYENTEVLNKMVKRLLLKSINRAKLNNRTTVMVRDL